jgi:hypothetical protein
MSEAANIWTMKQLERQIGEALENPATERRFSDGLENILFVWSTLLQTKGAPGWLAQVHDRHGKRLFTDEEARDLEAQLQPLATAVLQLVEKDDGTGEESNEEELPEPSLQRGGGDGEPIGMDEAVEQLTQKIEGIDAYFNELASKYGILGIEREYDGVVKGEGDAVTVNAKDTKPFVPLGMAIQSLGTAAVLPPVIEGGILIGGIHVPLRLIVAFTNVALDALRLMTSLPGFDMPLLRKLLSLGQSIFELLQGDWKKALLTFAGFFSQNYVYAGIFGKLFLTLFRLINPEFQESILKGTLPVARSFVFGILLQAFQLFATESVREEFIKGLVKIGAFKDTVDNRLKEVGYQPLSDLYKPSFEDIQRIQSALRNKSIVCTDVYATTMLPLANTSLLVKLLFQMMNLPTSKEGYDSFCQNVITSFPEGTPRTIAEGAVGASQKAPTGEETSTAEVVAPNAPTEEASANKESTAVPHAPPAETPPTPLAPLQPVGAQTQDTPSEIPKSTQSPSSQKGGRAASSRSRGGRKLRLSAGAASRRKRTHVLRSTRRLRR